MLIILYRSITKQNQLLMYVWHQYFVVYNIIIITVEASVLFGTSFVNLQSYQTINLGTPIRINQVLIAL